MLFRSRLQRPFRRSGRIVRAGTPDGFNGFRVILRFFAMVQSGAEWNDPPRASFLVPGARRGLRRPPWSPAPAVVSGARRSRGSRFGDVTSARIVRGGLARIKRRWIASDRARTARAGMDFGERTWNYVSRPWGGPLSVAARASLRQERVSQRGGNSRGAPARRPQGRERSRRIVCYASSRLLRSFTQIGRAHV